MDKTRLCRDCADPAIVIDLDYDEGYCGCHFKRQQRSSEPVINYQWIDEP